MSRALKSLILACFVISITIGSVAAEQGGVSLGVNVGTLGIGGDLTIGLAPKANIRIKANGFKYKYDTTQDDISYKFDLGLLSAMSVIDLHPTGGGFRLSGGLMLNKNKIDADAQPSTTYTIGNTSYAPNEVGTMTGKLDFKTIAPYAGLGWGNGVGEDKKLGFALDVGLAFQGSPKADLVATGGILSTDATFLANLEQEERNLENDVKSFKVFPVITFGLSYRFR